MDSPGDGRVRHIDAQAAELWRPSRAKGRRRTFHGIADDYNPLSSCKAFLARLKSAGRDVELTEYADVQHGFDSPLGTVVVAKGAQTVRACTIKEGPAGVLVNTATGAPF